MNDASELEKLGHKQKMQLQMRQNEWKTKIQTYARSLEQTLVLLTIVKLLQKRAADIQSRAASLSSQSKNLVGNLTSHMRESDADVKRRCNQQNELEEMQSSVADDLRERKEGLIKMRLETEARRQELLVEKSVLQRKLRQIDEDLVDLDTKNGAFINEEREISKKIKLISEQFEIDIQAKSEKSKKIADEKLSHVTLLALVNQANDYMEVWWSVELLLRCPFCSKCGCAPLGIFLLKKEHDLWRDLPGAATLESDISACRTKQNRFLTPNSSGDFVLHFVCIYATHRIAGGAWPSPGLWRNYDHP